MNKTIDLKISRVAYEGKGIGFYQGKIVFVPGGITGDYLRVEIIKEKANFIEASKITELSPNPLRQKKVCEYATTCGGCQWSGVNYDHQSHLKKTFILDAMRRIAKLDIKDQQVSVKPSPKDSYYRNRVTLRGRIKEDGSIVLGFFKRKSRELVPIKKCLITSYHLNNLISSIQNLRLDKQASIIPFRLELQELSYEKEQHKPFSYVLFHSLNNSRKLDPIIVQLKKDPTILWVGYDYEAQQAPVAVLEHDKNISYVTCPGVFQQVNSSHNNNLRAHVKSIIEKLNPKSILDLYCGSGNISLPLANGTRKILGVELSKESIQLAKINVKTNNLKNIEYIKSSVHSYLKELANKKSDFSCVILDPPRKGAKDDLVFLNKLLPKHIIYISCDPTTCARDLHTLKEHYQLVDITGFDFFPDTYHIETVVILKRKNKSKES